MNKTRNITDAIASIPDGASVMVGGFGKPGTPFTLLDELFKQGTKGLTLIKNDANENGMGISRLIENGQVDKLITTHIGLNKVVIELMNIGELKVEFHPQGILAEKIRTAGAGSYGFLSDIGLHSEITKQEDVIQWRGKPYKLESALRADYALIHANAADRLGNLSYAGSASNFSPLMAMAADTVIVETGKILEPGIIRPELVHTPCAFVGMVVEVDVSHEFYAPVEGRYVS
jgi:acetate CoA/acetoacetate CoA-transferase alpha subunit